MNPGVPFSRMKAEIPRVPLVLSVMAKITYTSASPAFVMKIFVPLITYSSPSNTAVVCCPAASVPAFGSVKPKAANFLPVHKSVKNLCFCSSVPN